jgi:hypothetical protein
LQDQPKGEPGPIRGRFLILDVGNNKHSISLMQFLGVTTDAQELVTVLRRSYPACVNVVNANILTVEEPLASQELGKEPNKMQAQKMVQEATGQTLQINGR